MLGIIRDYTEDPDATEDDTCNDVKDLIINSLPEENVMKFQ